MRQIFIHLILAFIVVTQVGCTVKILTFGVDIDPIHKDFDQGLIFRDSEE